ncbi:hypothetical protein C2845_PM10G15770 [Panicum miliaceum]|uniref:HNH endonuclease n=1 Tax=Panicum miliaceum TaxID=4540 RepID=A0A3L6PGI8_PANMI|nr:hypothetical protein C2845_PM10G15770 [Panicum miliaceum]
MKSPGKKGGAKAKSPNKKKRPGTKGGGSSPNLDDRRTFNQYEKVRCWMKADEVPGRDPNRWRADAAGNKVCKRYAGKFGLFGFEYDRIDPYAEGLKGFLTGGETDIANGQILQPEVNRAKSDTKEFSLEQMKDASRALDYTYHELGIAEIAAYEGVFRPGRVCRVLTAGEVGETYVPKDDLPCCGNSISQS